MEEEEEVAWIEDGDDGENFEGGGDDEDVAGFDLFATNQTDPSDMFKVTLGDVNLKLSGIQAKYPHLLQSTGMTLWKGSEKLCDYLCAHQEIVKDKDIVELGAGLGLCGIVAHKHGAHRVILTDGDTDTLNNMRSNVASNINDEVEDKIICKQLLWGNKVEEFCNKWAPNGGFDIVMGGDIAYAQESLEILFQTAMELLSTKPASVFILSFVFRGGVTIESVSECAKRHNLQWIAPEGNTEGVYIFSRSN